ncbi:hypothetical protein [Paraburkholderia bannensis]|uniref:hypothetical protein n=1 Tax=Paraburkholderia bannensis TaxID=765414 RepID=UPI002ABD8B4E|nr:hypothetical protein [Paraburkholderia bannensis]
MRLQSAIVLASIALLTAACDQQAADTPKTSNVTNAASGIAAPVTQTAHGFNESAGASAQSALPPSCKTYLAKIDACVAKLGAQSDVGRQLKESADEARRQWPTAQEPEAVGEMCKQAVANFAQSAAEAGCS